VSRLAAALILPVLAAIQLAWAATPIADIVAEPERWAGRDVTVVGTVLAPSAAYLGDGVYTLSADERRITVFSKGGAPTPGARLEVTARVGWREGDEEFTWPPVLFESTRRAAP
jgi:hypothetical protein